AIVCVGMQLLLPAFNPNSPRAVDVQYLEDGQHPQWVVDGVTPQIDKFAHFMLAPRDLYPWSRSRVRAYTAPAPQLSFAAPELDVVRDVRQNGRDVTLRIRSLRNAP